MKNILEIVSTKIIPSSSHLGKAISFAEGHLRTFRNFDIQDQQENIEGCCHPSVARSRGISIALKGRTQPF
jgi:hypothetical protein